jgi:hypothetical protein
LEIWDFRDRKRVANIEIANGGVSSLKVDNTGLMVAVGQEGVVDLFDVRFDKRISTIRHAYIEPIKSIEFEQDTKNVISCTKKQIKITDQMGKLFTSI